MSFLSKKFKYVNSLGQEVTFTRDNGYLISLPEGIDTLSVTVATAQGIGQVGATVQSKSIQPRPITVNGKIVGDYPQQLKDNLISVVRPDLTGTLYADDWRIDVYVSASPTIGAADFGANFQFSLVAPYPYWQNMNGKESQLRGIKRLFKFPWNLSKPYMFGKTSELKYIIVKNFGQFDVPFTLNIKCLGDKAVNVGLENILTNESLVLEKTLVNNEKVTIQTAHGRTTVTSSIDGDCRGALSLDSDLTRIHTGDNALKPIADFGLESLQISIEYAEESAGVTVT